MTKNQIEYQKLVETKRANQAQETITRMRDANTHSVAVGQLNEAIRHNYATEGQERQKLYEMTRHNEATEQVALMSAQETARHNAAAEALQGQQITLGYQQLSETSRHNYAMENETNRHNVAVENESARANLARETIDRFNVDSLDRYRSSQIGLGYSELNEKRRSNMVYENLDSQRVSWQVHQGSSQLMETHRANLANEQLIREKLAEIQRSNLERENLNAQQFEETKRANAVYEGQRDKELNIALGRAVTGGIKDLSSSNRDRSFAASKDLDTADRMTRIIIQGADRYVSSAQHGFGGGNFGGGVSRGEAAKKK